MQWWISCYLLKFHSFHFLQKCRLMLKNKLFWKDFHRCWCLLFCKFHAYTSGFFLFLKIQNGESPHCSNNLKGFDWVLSKLPHLIKANDMEWNLTLILNSFTSFHQIISLFLFNSLLINLKNIIFISSGKKIDT